MGRMRTSFFIVIVVFSAVMIAGCGGGDGSDQAASQGEQDARGEAAEGGGQAEGGTSAEGGDQTETADAAGTETETIEAETAEAEQAEESGGAGGSDGGADAELVQQGNNERPEKFPKDAVEAMSEFIASGEPKLSKETVEKVETVYERAGEIEQGDQEALNELLDEIGFSGIQDFIEANTATLMGIDALLSLGQVQKVIDASEEEHEAAEDYQISEAVESITQQALAASKLTEKDLRFVYENWKMVADVKRLAESGQ